VSLDEFRREGVRDEVALQGDPAGPPPTYGSDEELAEAAPRAPRRRRLWLRSLTSRLVAGVVALVVLLVAAVGSGTYYFMRENLLQRLDQQVASTAQQNAPYVERCLIQANVSARVQTNCPNTGPPQTVHEWVAVLERDGSVPASFGGGNVTTLKLTSDQRSAFVKTPTRMVTLHSGGTDLRVTARPATRLPLIIVTGLSTGDVDRTLNRLIRLELLIGGAAVLLAFGATSWGVTRSLRNLYRVTGTAREVAAELSPEGHGLDRRVPVTDPGTEVGQLAESMNTLLSAVETQFAARLESEQRMRQFLADASHELRTPLTSIRGYAELARMQRAANGESQTGSADNLDRIESEGTRMSRLVDDLLMLARGDADAAARSTEPEVIDVADLLDDAVSGSRAAFPDRPIEVHVEPAPAVLGDRDQLLRIVRNLITNAAVHTEAGRPILVRGFRDAGGTVVTVADGGPGLPPDQAAHVFERFWRADKARTRARGGSGLGLAIVAAIVAAHGGSVRFDSTVESGSTVTVWLPGID
jgi:two-component system OmpR family sensor kinase